MMISIKTYNRGWDDVAEPVTDMTGYDLLREDRQDMAKERKAANIAEEGRMRRRQWLATRHKAGLATAVYS